MIPTPSEAWVFARFMADQPPNGELAALSEPWRTLAVWLDATSATDRGSILAKFLDGRPDRDDITEAIADQDGMGPAPAPPRRFATCADVLKLETAVPWAWEGWLPSNRIVGIAAGEGIGKTRLAMDLAQGVARGALARQTAHDTAPQVANALGCGRWPARRARPCATFVGHAARVGHFSDPGR